MIRILVALILGVSMSAAESRTLVLGGGCFWCLEAAYELVPGVSDVVSGYAGGHLDDPDYEAVCRKTTGHAEVVRITYDPAQVDLERLLALFWRIHDPTTRNRQGGDVGPQYRSIILTQGQDQEAAVRASMAAEAPRWSAPLVTEVLPLETQGAARFHPAEEEHQDYFRRNPGHGYCQAVVKKKVHAAKEFLADGMVVVRDLGPAGQLLPPAPVAKVRRSSAEWKALLSPEAFAVLRHEGTEPPFCGGLLAEKRSGWFLCAGCRLPLFSSTAKFESGTGWPSFFAEAARENVMRLNDRSHGMVRTEIRCARCDGHLGHVFDDGPAPTFTRHCLNSAALVFEPTP